MSESEKAQRAAYQAQRKKLLTIFLAVILGLSVLTATMAAIFLNLNAETYVYFREEGNALYHAYLNDNDYYEEDYLNGDHAYVSSLIHHMDAAFTYRLEMDVEDVTYRYQYRVDAQLAILDKDSGAAIFNPVETLLGPTQEIFTGRVLLISPKVDIDYVHYNEAAKDFIDHYNLDGVSAVLNVTMYVDIVGMSETFAADNEGQYTIQVQIPLNQNVLKPQTNSTIPEGPQKILANANTHKKVFKILAIVFGALDGLGIIATIVFTIKTRDIHIDYARKVQKLVSSYKSFIQKINNPFDQTEYQVLLVDTFNEMLEIRDTLQSPILMYENEDKTCTSFWIPCNSHLLYMFEIKVENFEQLYARTEDEMPEPPASEELSDTETSPEEHIANLADEFVDSLREAEDHEAAEEDADENGDASIDVQADEATPNEDEV